MQQLFRQHDFSAQSRQDPTKTTILRQKYERALVRRFREIQAAIEVEIVEKDGFALRGNAAFDAATSERKVGTFLRWLRKMQDEKILEIKSGTPVDSAARASWQNVYISSAYQKGLASSVAEMRKSGVEVSQRWIDASFFRPIHADRVGLIYIRAYSDLEGITKAMDTKISRSLALSMAEGKGMRAIADQLHQDVESLGINRARVLARTEVIRSHADATLNSYEEAEIEGVEVRSEFTTANDNRVCEKCKKLEGKTYTLQEARGVIPVHPNCRCAWLPVIPDATGKKLM